MSGKGGIDTSSLIILAMAVSFISPEEPLSAKAEAVLRRALLEGLIKFADARFIEYVFKFMRGGLEEIVETYRIRPHSRDLSSTREKRRQITS